MSIGVDLSGTKIETALPDEAGTVLFRRSIKTRQRDYLATVAAIAEPVERADSEVGCDASGVRGAARLWPGEGAA